MLRWALQCARVLGKQQKLCDHGSLQTIADLAARSLRIKRTALASCQKFSIWRSVILITQRIPEDEGYSSPEQPCRFSSRLCETMVRPLGFVQHTMWFLYRFVPAE